MAIFGPKRHTDKTGDISVDTVGITQAMLRLSPTKNKQEKHVHWAHDYEL